MAAIAASSLVGAAQAATLSGQFFDVGGFNTCCAGSSTGTPQISTVTQAIAYVAANAATGTFQSSGISYNMTAPHTIPATIGAFLGADSASLTPGVGTRDFLGTILTFAGKINLAAGNNRFDVFSDDGFALYVNGTEVGRLGLRPPGTTTLNLMSSGGVADFYMVYFEGSQTQGALQVKLNGEVLTAVPVPASALLLLGAVGGLAALRRRAA